MTRKDRIDVDFGGGYDSILYSVRDNRFYSYEQETEEIHNRYGGRQYYSSRSGMSGAGFLETDPTNNDLILFGYYRTDAAGEQRIATVHTVNGQPIFGYAPIISHSGIDNDAPFVLSDGNKVAFVSGHNVRSTLLEWEDIEGKEITLTYYDEYGDDRQLVFKLHNPNHFRGVRATRFIDLRHAREATHDQYSGETVFEQKLNIVEATNGNWYHLSIDGIFDQKWTDNPRSIEGEIVQGWSGAGDGLYWRRGRNGVQAFMDIKRSELNDGKYVVEGETAEYIDYEQDFSVLEWFSKNIDDYGAHFVTMLTKKARQDYVYARQRSGIDTRQLMEQNPDARICIQDSLDCGNCRPGTEDFIKRYGIKADEDGCCLVKDLLENKNIDEMLRNFNFQKVVVYKLMD